MKKTKVIIPALGMLLLSTAASVTGTVAWFSSNASVNATGMGVSAKTSQSLVIDVDHAVEADVSVAFSAFANALTPISYIDGGYKYVTAAQAAKISPETGLQGEAVLTAVPGAVEAGLYFYADYVVYLAAAGLPISGATLNATVSFATAQLTQRAVTIDFQIGASAVSADITQGDLVPDHSKTVNATMEGSDLTVSFSGVSFPLNTTNTSIPVLMRVYFDGALEETIGTGTDAQQKAIVRSEAVKTDALGISVNFTI